MQSHPRIVRYAELKPCRDAFIDTRTPGSDAKENFTIIGPGVSENPNQHVHIAEPHGFNIGGARQPAGCTNSQHSHDTAEVFYVHSGQWRFLVGEHGNDAQVDLGPGDIISIPTQVFRGFTNISAPDAPPGYLFAVLGKDDPGRVLWTPAVFDMAKDYGLVLMASGKLIDTRAGQVVPDGEDVMPVTTPEQMSLLATLDDEWLRACCVKAEDAAPETSDGTALRRDLIGSGTLLDWDHGFRVEELRIPPNAQSSLQSLNVADVVFVQSGSVRLTVGEEIWALGTGDTATVPKGLMRRLHNISDTPAVVLRVLGTTT